MRGTIGRRLPYSSFGFSSNASARQMLIPFSTSSSSGGGRGRGRGGPTRFGVNSPAPSGSLPDEDPSPPGLGHGRGRPLPSSPTLPSFSSFVASVGRGRGGAPAAPTDSDSKKPVFFKREDVPPKWTSPPPDTGIPEQPSPEVESRSYQIPDGILSALSGAGRGKPLQRAGPEAPAEENRHLRARPRGPHPEAVHRDAVRRPGEKFSGDGPEGSMDGGHGGFGRGRGGRGRGRGLSGRGGRGRASFKDRGQRDSADREAADDLDDDDGLFLGDKADGEKFANRMGAEKMEMLTEIFEEIGSKVLPSPTFERHLDAFHTNCLIEFEPEYLMEEFGTNPDIDEKPPIPLREAIEKMKPFLMVYEGIETQEEWEKVVKATMDHVPLMKEIVDYYSGPDRVTAKQQQQELERVAKTLPESAPASVKRFTDRAVLSLQSNPGWGFDKKCQFMDKLVLEVSQQYK
ncbi:hypothetical protein SAY87_005710 [Trapa incisa]|uniref:Hydroxyproline-rich glycoprotein family protein n=1 Tax=Trapa incisa TaxID=236973 RepID=A0AAN7Q7H1_9MYRT|nr:hypothetical protein SAY87_005710 [Trapa incisa]